MPNTARGYVKSADSKFGNDPIFNMRNFDESSRWIYAGQRQTNSVRLP